MTLQNSNGVFPPQLNSDISIPTCGGKGKRRVKQTRKRRARKSSSKPKKAKKTRRASKNFFFW